jgi:hypothetical protein
MKFRIRENGKTHFRFNPTQKVKHLRVHCTKNLHREISGESCCICLGQKRYKKYV